jgi:hypothetical protein
MRLNPSPTPTSFLSHRISLPKLPLLRLHSFLSVLASIDVPLWLLRLPSIKCLFELCYFINANEKRLPVGAFFSFAACYES